MTDKVKSMMSTLTPELQAMAQDYAKLKVEVKLLNAALSTSQKQYAEILLFIMAVLRQMPDYEIRFRAKDLEAYSMFKEAWQLESFCLPVDGVDYQVLRLKEKGGEG